MAGSTSGGISDLAFVMNMRIDESSVTDAMKTLGDMKSQVNAFRMEHGIDGGVEQKKAAELEKEARFQAEFNQLLKEEAAEKSAIAARDSAIAQGREQHLAEQKRLLLDYYQTEEKAGQAREARFQVEFNQLLQLEAAQEASEQQRLAAEQAQADAAETAFAAALQQVAQLDAAEEAREQKRLAAQQALADAAETEFAEAQQHVAQLDAAEEAREQKRLAAQQALADAAETEFAEMLQHVAQLDAAEEAREQNRLAAVNAEVNAIEGDMTRALRRTLNIEDQINFDYQRRLEAIDAIQGATAQQTAELRLQAAAVRDAATQTAINAGQIGGIGAAGLTGNRIQEFGRGFEDFTVGFSMAKTNIEGIAMGLRGASNNAAQLAASFDPMLGATVAIGASLATVIVPMVARWLFDTKALAEAQDAWNDKLKESGKEQMKVADALAKMRGTIREDADAKPGEKGKKIVDDVKKAEKDALAAKEKGSSRQLTLNAAEQKAAESTAKKKKLEQERDYALIDATVAAGANLAAGGLNPERAAESKASTDALYIKQAEYDLAVKEAELSESAAKNAREDVKDTKTEMETTAAAEAAIKLKYGAKIAEAEKNIQADAKEKLQEKLDDANDKAEKNAIKSAERQYEEDVKNIKALKLIAAEENEMVADATEIRRLKIERVEEALVKKEQAKLDKEEARLNKYEDMQQRIDADSAKATKSKEDDIMAAYNKRTEEINRLEGNSDDDKLAREKLHASNLATFTSKMDQEQAAQNDKLAVKRIDAELQANADQQDALKESMDKAGNAAGPSAAMVSGTQAAESAINRALSGSQSVEGTMKAQLKELQKIHTSLEAQKKVKTVSL